MNVLAMFERPNFLDVPKNDSEKYYSIEEFKLRCNSVLNSTKKKIRG